jgi:hypothetical protein
MPLELAKNINPFFKAVSINEKKMKIKMYYKAINLQ